MKTRHLLIIAVLCSSVATATVCYFLWNPNAPELRVIAGAPNEGTLVGLPQWFPFNSSIGVVEVRPKRGVAFPALVNRPFALPPGSTVKTRAVQYLNWGTNSYTGVALVVPQ